MKETQVLEITLKGDAFKRFQELTDVIEKSSGQMSALRKANRELRKELEAGNISYEKYSEEVRKNNDQLSEFQVISKGAKGEARELSNELSGLTAAGLRFRDKMADANTEALKQTGILGQLEARSAALVNDIEQLNVAYKKGDINAERYNKELSKLTQEQKEVAATTDKLEREVEQLNKDFRNGKISSEEFRKGIQGIGVSAQSTGARLTNSITKGIGAMSLRFLGLTTVLFAAQRALAGAARTVVEFDANLSKLAGILGKTKDEIRLLKEQAIQLGGDTAFTAGQVVELQVELAKLGQTAGEIQDSTAAILDLGAAAGTDLANAGVIATQTLNAFNLKASDTQRLVDVIAKTLTSSAIDIDKFSGAMQNAAPAAAAVGQTVERTSAQLSALIDNGLRAEKAGTGLRRIFTELKQTGLTYEDALDKINTSSDKYNTALQIFGDRGATAALILAENAEKVDTLEQSYLNAAGAASELADAQLDNLRGDRLILQSAWDKFVLSVDDGSGAISRGFRNMFQDFTRLFNFLSELNEQTIDEKLGLDLSRFGGRAGEVADQMQEAYEEVERVIARLTSADAFGESASIEELVQKREELIAEAERLRRIDDSSGQFALQARSIEAAIDDFLSPAIAKLSEANDNLAGSTGESSSKLEEQREKLEELRAEREALIQQRQVLKKTDTDGLLILDNTIKRIDGQINGILGLTKATKELSKVERERLERLNTVNNNSEQLFNLTGQQFETSGINSDDPERRGPLGPGPSIADILDSELPSYLAGLAAYDQAFAESAENRFESEADAINRIRELNELRFNEDLIGAANVTASLDALFKTAGSDFKGFAIAEAIINTYRAANAVLASSSPQFIVNPFLRFSTAGFTIASGLANVAQIQAQGFATGGFTGAGNPSDVAGVVHKNEWVASSPMVNRFPALFSYLQSIQANKQYQTGGFTSQESLDVPVMPAININPIVSVQEIIAGINGYESGQAIVTA